MSVTVLRAIQKAEAAIREIPVDDDTIGHRNQALWAMVTLGDDVTLRMSREHRPADSVTRLKTG